MKTITDDPIGFFDSGGWTFLDPESDGENGGHASDESEEDDAYEPTDLESEEESDDDSEYSEASEDDDSDSDEGLSLVYLCVIGYECSGVSLIFYYNFRVG